MKSKTKTIIAIFVAIILILSIIYFYKDKMIGNKDKQNNQEAKWKPFPKTGIRRNPELQYIGGSNPSTENSWQMFKHDLQRTSFSPLIGNGNISNYSLLYHRWQALAQPVVADFNDDGKYEIISCSEGTQDYETGIWYSHGIKMHDYKGNVLWNFKKNSPITWVSPAIADTNKDNSLEIIIPLRSDGTILILNKDGKKLYEYLNEEYSAELSSPAVADINKDRNIDIIFGAGNFTYAITLENDKLKLLWKFQTQDAVLSSPALVDLDNDSYLETIIGSYDNYLYCLDYKGNLLWKFLADDIDNGIYDGIYTPPSVVDLDGDGNLEIIFQHFDHVQSNYLYVLNSKGKELWNITTGFILSSPTVGDINNDGWIEIIFGDENNLYVFDLEGKELFKVFFNELVGPSTIVDLNGDGNLEIVVISQDYFNDKLSSSNLTILSNQGKILWKYHINGSSWTNVPVVDLNKDGKLELIVGVYSSFPDGMMFETENYAKLGLYVFGDLSSYELIDNLPDLAIIGSMLNITHPNQVQTKIQTKISNAGLVSAENITVEIRTNFSVVLNTTIIEKILPLSDVQIETTFYGRVYNITVVIDPRDEILEGDEDNNETIYIEKIL